MLGCKKDLPIQIQTINKIVDTIPIVQFKEFTFSGLSVNHMGYDINAPIFIDYDGNGKLDMILSQRKQQRIGNIYTYDLLNPIVISKRREKRMSYANPLIRRVASALCRADALERIKV